MAGADRKGRTARTGASLLCGLAAGLLLARCGAEGIAAPDSTGALESSDAFCRSLQDYMPRFYATLRAGELRGLAQVVTDLDARARGGANPLGALVQTALRTLKMFASDPYEAPPDRCVPYNNPSRAPPEPESANRMCAVRRALDFAVRDEAARQAFDALTPVLVKVLGYVTNESEGKVGAEHYEALDVLHRMSLNEAQCPPRNLVEVLDGLATYFGAGPDCAAPPAGQGEECHAYKLLATLRAILSDKAVEDFLETFQSSVGGSQGRDAVRTLVKVLSGGIVAMPENEHYFDQMQSSLDDLVYRFLESQARSHPDKGYDRLEEDVKTLVAVLKDFLDPSRKGAVLHPLKGVVACILEVDSGGEVAGALYDLLSRQGGQGGGGLDLLELVDAVSGVAHADPRGVLSGAAHVVLRETARDEVAMEAFRVLFQQTLDATNVRLLAPALKAIVERQVVTELVEVLDNLLYGCRAPATLPPE